MSRDYNRLTDRDQALGEAGLVTTDLLVEAARNNEYRRVEIAALYGVALAYDGGHIDWPTANNAIIERWSLSALKYIKALAWGAVTANGEGQGTAARR